MGEKTAIPWCDHTFNPWWGCSKVSTACFNCYAERQAARFGEWWGPGARRFFGAAHWREPLKWNRKAREAGVCCRVFVASMADVFEDRPDLVEPRGQLIELIRDTPRLVWLMLTKRPENIDRLGPSDWPENVWLGTTVENQAAVDRIPSLLDGPISPIRFVSVEPLLGPIRLDLNGIDWVIVGDESGPHRRPAELEWVRDIRDQCVEWEASFFFKQWHVDGVKVECPELDGRQWVEFPR